MMNRSISSRLIAGMVGLTGILLLTSAAQAAGGQILPEEKILLSAAAEVTAVYNTGGPLPRFLPFEVLSGGAGNVTVKEGTILYAPIFFADDSGTPDPAPFPSNLRNQEADADYLIDAIEAYTGLDDVDAFFIEVDGKVTILGDDSVVGVTTPPLPDGGGNHYIVSAAFITPLSRGNHTVVIGAVLSDGTKVGPPGYNVTVIK